MASPSSVLPFRSSWRAPPNDPTDARNEVQPTNGIDPVPAPVESEEFDFNHFPTSLKGEDDYDSKEIRSTNDIDRLLDPAESEDDYGSDGDECELHIYEARFDTRGERVVLRAGTKRYLGTPAKKKSHRASLVVTRHYSRWNPQKVHYTELEVQSKHIIVALRKVIGTYQGIDFTSKTVSIMEPPRCLFHYRDKLRQHAEASGDQELKEHMHLILQYTERVLSQEIKMFDSFLSGRLLAPEIEHSQIWMLFSPGCLVYEETNLGGKLSRLRSIEEEKDPKTYRVVSWILYTEHVRQVYGKIGLAHHQIKIGHYDGRRPIFGLSAIPLHFHPEEDRIRQDHLKQGRCHPAGFILGSQAYDSTEKASQNLSEEEVMTCSSLIRGISLESRSWCYFRVNDITEVAYNDAAFEGLVLHEQKKRLIRSLVGHDPTSNSNEYDDLIQGKGRGLIFLLHGPPGVGKTFTAESIADHTRRPLLKITSGELSLGGAWVEERLSLLFSLATRWNAIILLDEADAFMQERKLGSFESNWLVSTLLRVLEYYRGIMFLTTNRVETLDHAFKSRIHLCVSYPPLSADARRQLWKATISRAHAGRLPEWLTPDIMDQFVDPNINGREIRNIVSTGLALARGDKRGLIAADIFDALTALKQFESDFGRSLGGSEA
ncbi:AAA family ATPase [Apiospora hydei]|uniref:AAA family ATPase n=1 Tax=Apiospora hydei TaxID=1337664 RepID=A0ABR1WLR3_9PEZI